MNNLCVHAIWIGLLMDTPILCKHVAPFMYKGSSYCDQHIQDVIEKEGPLK